MFAGNLRENLGNHQADDRENDTCARGKGLGSIGFDQHIGLELTEGVRQQIPAAVEDQDAEKESEIRFGLSAKEKLHHADFFSILRLFAFRCLSMQVPDFCTAVSHPYSQDCHQCDNGRADSG
nr:hypothetical protein [uncultured Faecalibaculum sp.]